MPVYFLDSGLPENSEWDRTLTHYLYGGDLHYRFCQEVILGIGGVRMLRALGHREVSRYHMNEGHSSLLALELLDEEAERAGRPSPNRDDVQTVREKCVFTTHTPVAAGHDQFQMALVHQILGRHEVEEMKDVFCCAHLLNMTFLALNLSPTLTGLPRSTARLPGSCSPATTSMRSPTASMRPPGPPNPSPSFTIVTFPLAQDNSSLRSAMGIAKQEIWQAHRRQKGRCFSSSTGKGTPGWILMYHVGFARRAAAL